MRYVFGEGRSKWIPWLLLMPGMIFYFLVALGPSLATAVYSLTDATGIVGIPIEWIGFDNYEEFLLLGTASQENIAAGLRTIKFSFWVSTIQFVAGLIVALLLNQNLPGMRFFRVLFFFPVILGVTVQGLMWDLFLYPLDGPMVQFLALFNLKSTMLGGMPSQAFRWVIFIQIWANMGITMVIFLSGLQTIPQELIEAAEMDGANRWQLFKNVTWPLITPSVHTNILLNIIGSLQAWQLFYVLVGYKPSISVLGWLVFAEGFGQTSGSMTLGFRQGYAAAASIVLFLLVLIVGLIVQYYLDRRERNILGEGL